MAGNDTGQHATALALASAIAWTRLGTISCMSTRISSRSWSPFWEGDFYACRNLDKALATKNADSYAAFATELMWTTECGRDLIHRGHENHRGRAVVQTGRSDFKYQLTGCRRLDGWLSFLMMHDVLFGPSSSGSR